MKMGERSRVLLVDDDELSLQMLAASLEDSYELQSVTSGAEALALCEQQPFDLVLLDVEMPELNGYEVCRRLRASEAGAQLSVVFLSAHSSIEERLLGYEAGGDDYVAKPFEVAELLAKFERLLGQRARQRELSGQLDEVMSAVLSSADMVGEAGVVLEFQRRLNGCADYKALAQALFESLQRFGLEGCVRIQGRGEALLINAKGGCTALESSILEHLHSQTEGARIRPLGPHTSFHFGSVLLFVRDLQLQRPAEMDRAESERLGRAIDNIALLVEGAVTRVAALDSELATRDLANFRHLVGMTRDALTDISARNKAQSQEVHKLFESLSADVENSFLHLGLTHVQEEHLSGIIKQYMDAVLQTLDQSQEVEQFLGRVINKLGTYA
ncbi:response regulator [Paucibacter sp. APW11]|uniref:Response regulator n=1 Tax=Roseateles aquae TaxID=3077235 RepID=A0ABU3PC57_9BURK|nr:response regulator [Paucibacter sp. APW11]MDT9000156.1 response regulator [Paucibacter sp. APW11]